MTKLLIPLLISCDGCITWKGKLSICVDFVPLNDCLIAFLNPLRTELLHMNSQGAVLSISPTRFVEDLYQSIQSPLLDIELMLEGIDECDPYTSQKTICGVYPSYLKELTLKPAP